MKKILIILLFICAVFANAQDNDSTNVKKDPKADFAEMTKSPMGALARSLILPGWGQLYVESYWKAPLMFGGFATVGYIIYWNDNNYRTALDDMAAYLSFENDYRKPIDVEKAIVEKKNSYQYTILKNRRDFYRDQRDLAGLYMLGVYIISAVDAYVGAHLYDFNVDNDLSVNIVPNKFGIVSLSVSYKF